MELSSSGVIRALDLVEVKTIDSAVDGLPFLDLAIKAKSSTSGAEFAGPGLYAMGHHGRVVYVGSFRGKKKAGQSAADPFGGNVVRARWQLHLGSSTARGVRASSPATNVPTMLAQFPGSPLLLALNGGGERFAGDKGCQVSKNRLRFAHYNWDAFMPRAGFSAEELLAPFSFVYVRVVPGSVAGSVESIRKAVRAAETLATRSLSPVINEGLPWVVEGARPYMSNVADVLRSALEACAPDMDALTLGDTRVAVQARTGSLAKKSPRRGATGHGQGRKLAVAAEVELILRRLTSQLVVRNDRKDNRFFLLRPDHKPCVELEVTAAACKVRSRAVDAAGKIASGWVVRGTFADSELEAVIGALSTGL